MNDDNFKILLNNLTNFKLNNISSDSLDKFVS